ncbi:MAG: hypothetical protein ACI9LE_000102 [Paraglaciecola sp.]|jgi:hypothetical protein
MIAVIADYKTVFSEYHNGSTSFIHLLSKPIATTCDAAINQDDTGKLKVASDKSAIFSNAYPNILACRYFQYQKKPTLHIIQHTIDSVITFR